MGASAYGLWETSHRTAGRSIEVRPAIHLLSLSSTHPFGRLAQMISRVETCTTWLEHISELKFPLVLLILF